MNIYLVAETRGGMMEDPEITYHNPEVIEAESQEEARKNMMKKIIVNFFMEYAWQKM